MDQLNLDENGKINDITQARKILHDLSVDFMALMLENAGEIREDRGPVQVSRLIQRLFRIHEITCTEKREEAKEVKGGTLDEWLSRMTPPASNSSVSLN